MRGTADTPLPAQGAGSFIWAMMLAGEGLNGGSLTLSVKGTTVAFEEVAQGPGGVAATARMDR